jgi:transposase
MIPSSVRIFVCVQPQDMRRSFDMLALAAQQTVGQDPRGGAMFVFTNRRRSQLKVLWWDHNGYCLLYKRLHRALFHRRIRRNPASPRYRSTGPCSASCSPAWRLRGDERILLDMSRQLARKGRARRSSSTRRPCPGGGL